MLPLSTFPTHQTSLTKQQTKLENTRLKIRGQSGSGTFGGGIDIQKMLFMRLDISGFGVGIGWTHWNSRSDDLIDQMAIVSCKLSDNIEYQSYIGSERIVYTGNISRNSRLSHVVRIWQAYQGDVSHNIISGSSLDNIAGRHALKLHGPGDENSITPDHCIPGNGDTCLANRTEFVIISDNVIGTSGPWPVSIGPPDALSDTRLTDIIFEKNRVFADYGQSSSVLVNIPIGLEGRYYTARNNIIDGTGGTSGIIGIKVWQRGIEPAPEGVELYNNTIYRSDISTSPNVGIEIASISTGTIARNNLVSFPYATSSKIAIDNKSNSSIISNNVLTDAPNFLDPDNPSHLYRDFSLTPSSTMLIDKGYDVPVIDDIGNNSRLGGINDVGAYTY